MVPPSQDTSRQNSSPPPSLHLGVLTPPPKCEQEAQLSWPLSVDVAKSGKRRDLPRARHMPLVIRRGCRSPRQRKKALFLKFSSSLLGGGGGWCGGWGLGDQAAASSAQAPLASRSREEELGPSLLEGGE